MHTFQLSIADIHLRSSKFLPLLGMTLKGKDAIVLTTDRGKGEKMRNKRWETIYAVQQKTAKTKERDETSRIWSRLYHLLSAHLFTSLYAPLDSSLQPSGACLNSWCTPHISGTHFGKATFSHALLHFKAKASTPVFRDVLLFSYCTRVKTSWPSFRVGLGAQMTSVWSKDKTQSQGSKTNIYQTPNTVIQMYQSVCLPNTHLTSNSGSPLLPMSFLSKLSRVVPNDEAAPLVPVFVLLVFHSLCANLSLMMTPKLLWPIRFYQDQRS